MNKLLVVVVLILFGGAIKLAVDAHQQTLQANQLQVALNKIQADQLRLNDQLVALQRQPQAEVSPSVAPTVVEINAYDDQYLKAQLRLAQIALHHEQPMFALTQLTGLLHALDQYPLAEALRESLKNAITQDIQNIERYLNLLDQQNEVLQLQLQKINQLLGAEALTAELKVNDRSAFWQSWFHIKKDQELTAPLMQRNILLKEIQLRLQLMQYALVRDQKIVFVNEMTEIKSLIARLPDATAQRLSLQMQSLNQMQNLAKPKLASLALLGESA